VAALASFSFARSSCLRCCSFGELRRDGVLRSWIEVRGRISAVVVVLLLSGHATRWLGTLGRRGSLLGALAREVLWTVHHDHDDRHSAPSSQPILTQSAPENMAWKKPPEMTLFMV
jgi:hypothetical protein